MPFFLKNTIFVARKILTTTDRHLLERAIFIGSCLFHHRWRSLYNSHWVLEDGTIQAGDITVGQGSPRPVLQHPNMFPHGGRARRPPSYFKIHFLVAGGRGTETTVLL